MKKTLDQLDLKTLQKILNILDTNFQNELGLNDPQTSIYNSWSIPELGVSSKSNRRTVEEVLERLTGTESLSQAYAKIYERVDILKKTRQVEAPKGEDQTTPQNLDELEEQAEERAGKQEKARQAAKEGVARMQDRQKELYEEQQRLQKRVDALKNEDVVNELKDKKVYAKVEVDEKDQPKFENLDENDKKTISHYQELIKKEKFETAKEELTKELEQKAENELQKEGFSKEQIHQTAKETAEEVIENLSNRSSSNYVPPSYQTAILAHVSSDDSVIPKVVATKTAQELIKNSAGNVAVFKIQPEVLTMEVLKTAFGENFSSFVLGADPTKVKVTLTESLPQNIIQTATIQYQQVNFNELRQHQIQIHEGQINTIDGIVKSGREVVVDRFQSSVINFVSRKLESLPVTSVVKKVILTPEMQAVFFAKFGVGNPVTWQYMNPVLMRVMGQNQLAGAAFSALGKLTGKPIVTAVSSEVAGQVAGKVATQAAGKATGAGLGATIGAITGLSGGPLAIVTAAVGYVIGEVASKALSKLKVWWTKNKETIAPFLAIGAGLSLARFGFGPAILGGAGTYLIFGGTAAALLFGPLRFFQILARNIGIAIATPVIVTLLVLPPLVAFIMLVINNSAYVVPPSPPSLSRSSNPYISVIKTADPAGPFENSDLPLDITYTITISAKRDTLTNISFKDTCKIIQEASNVPCENSSYDVPDSISPGSSYTITYTNNYNKFLTDALIVNTFEVTATVGEAGEQSTSGAASIRIGNPPNQCFNIVKDGFNADQYSYALGAISKLQDEFNGYASKICASLGGKSIDIKYAGSDPNFWGWWEDGYIRLYSKGVESAQNANYVIFHELAHVLATYDDSWYNQYKSYPGITNEPYPYCFYDYPDETGFWPYSERFAEAASFYANDPCGNFRQKNPAHYKFMNDVLFK